MREFGLSLAFAALIAGATQAKELSYAHYSQPTHELHWSVAEKFAADVARVTNNEVTIKVYASGELGAGPTQQYKRALEGVADITQGLIGSDAIPMPRTSLMELPGLFDGPKDSVETLWANKELFADDFKRVELLAAFPNSPAIILSNKKITSPEDMKGLNIRASSGVAAAFVEELGATPVTMPAGDLYNALQTGVIDGALIGSDGAKAYRLNEVSKYALDGLPTMMTFFYVIANGDSYQSLSDEQRAKIAEVAGKTLSDSGREGFEKSSQAAYEAMAASKVEISKPADPAAFEAAAKTVREKFAAEHGAKHSIDAAAILNAVK